MITINYLKVAIHNPATEGLVQHRISVMNNTKEPK